MLTGNDETPAVWLVKGKANKKEMGNIGNIFNVPNDTLIKLRVDGVRNLSSLYFFRTYTFADGTPFDIREEQQWNHVNE